MPGECGLSDKTVGRRARHVPAGAEKGVKSKGRSADNRFVKESRTVMRSLAVVLGALALIVGGLFGWTSSRSGRPDFISSHADTAAAFAAGPRTAAEAGDGAEIQVESDFESQAENEEVIRYVVAEHTVVGGESFSLITGIYWDDIFLWPELYIHNTMRTSDPDLIYPDEIIDIYNRLGRGDEYSEVETGMILDAYIQVYDRYKSLGPGKDSSAWTLLWCGAKYSRDFLDIYADRIAPYDMEMAKRYIAEEGYLD